MNYGARVRGSVFRTLFFILAKEFQSIEISAEFACLLEQFFSREMRIFRNDFCDFTKKFASKYELLN